MTLKVALAEERLMSHDKKYKTLRFDSMKIMANINTYVNLGINSLIKDILVHKSRVNQ